MTNIQKASEFESEAEPVAHLILNARASQQLEQHAAAVNTLIGICIRPCWGDGYSSALKDAACRAGVVQALVAVLDFMADGGSQSPMLKYMRLPAVTSLGHVIFQHHENQTAAISAGAARILLQLATSNPDDPALQNAAADTLERTVFRHFRNERQLYSHIKGSVASEESFPASIASLFKQLKATFYGTPDRPCLLDHLNKWCDQANAFQNASELPPPDAAAAGALNATHYIDDATSVAFGAARSFSHSMHSSGIYNDSGTHECIIERVQQLRWLVCGELRAANGEWRDCPSGWVGVGFHTAEARHALSALLTHYAPLRWPNHAEQLASACSVKHVEYQSSTPFLASIRQALSDGHQPILSFSSTLLYRSPAAISKMAQGRTVSQSDLDPNGFWRHEITRNCAVVIGDVKASGEMELQDSNFERAERSWRVENVEVLAGPADDTRRCVHPPLDITWIHVPPTHSKPGISLRGAADTSLLDKESSTPPNSSFISSLLRFTLLNIGALICMAAMGPHVLNLNSKFGFYADWFVTVSVLLSSYVGLVSDRLLFCFFGVCLAIVVQYVWKIQF